VRHVLGLVVALSMASASPAAADAESRPALRVLLVVDRANDPLMARIQAEIAALGLTVASGSANGPLESSAREQRAVAAVRVLPSRKGVEVWMADATTGRTLTRQLVVDERAAGPDNTLVALQTAEILRTGLFPKADKPAAPPPTPVTTVQVVPAPPPRTGEWRLRNGLGGLFSRGGVDTAMQDWLTLQRWWHPHIGVGFSFSLPILRGSLSGPEGRSLVGAYMAGGELWTSFLEESSRWFLTGGLGGGILYLHTQAQSSTRPLEPASAGALTGVGYARVEFSLKVSSWARLGIAGTAGTTILPVTIRFADNQAGTWGSLLLASFMQFGVDW
jgi:hypothetical protein